MSKLTSIITSTYNKSKFLDLTLAGYAKQTDLEYEIVIINDGGTDNTEEIIDKYRNLINIKYVYQNNAGIASARNKALESAEGDFVIIVDDDRIPTPHFVHTHKKRLQNSNKVVSFGSQQRVISFYSNLVHLEYDQWMNLFKNYPHLAESMEETQLITAEDIMSKPYQVLDHFRIGEYDPALLLPAVQKYGADLSGFHFGWAKAFGGNIAFDRSLAKTQICYDSGYSGYGKEDTDLSYQLYMEGYQFVYCSDAINYHQEHPRGKNETHQHFLNFNRFCNKYESLEVFLHKLDQQGDITQMEANSFIGILEKYHSSILPKIHNYIDRKVASGIESSKN